MFSGGFDYSTTIKGSLAILSPIRGRIVLPVHSLMLKKAFSNVLNSPTIEKMHYGIFENNVSGTFKYSRNTHEAIMYAMCATKQLPEKIINMAKEVFELKAKGMKN